MPCVLPGPIKDIKFFHMSKETQRKMLVIAECGPGGKQARAFRMSSTMDTGEILGSSKALLCCANTAAFDTKQKTKFYTGGESGEIFMHEGP